MRGVRFAVLAVWLVAAPLTIAHAVRPHLYEVLSPPAVPVLDTLVASGAILLAVLAYGRWRQRSLGIDVATCYALSLLAVVNVLFVLLPVIVQPNIVKPDLRIAAFACGALVAVLFLVAVLSANREARLRPRLDLILMLVLIDVACISVGAIGHYWTGLFGGLVGHPSAEGVIASPTTTVAVVQGVSAAALFVASVGFASRSRTLNDAFFGWLAVAVALLGFARVNFMITPSHQVGYLSIGDWFRLAAYSVAVAGAIAELAGYWRRISEIAVHDERRRIARDMHDGLAQELALITTQAKTLMKTDDTGVAARLVSASERALDESRRAIAALTRPVDEPLEVALAQQAEEIGGRLGIRVLLDIEQVPKVPADTREALLRIAREAMSNAGRHARPSRITVHLSNHDGVTLKVLDDGRGFRPDDPSVYVGDRWGIAGMRERAEALGGNFTVQSRPYGGTRVEVWLP